MNDNSNSPLPIDQPVTRVLSTDVPRAPAADQPLYSQVGAESKFPVLKLLLIIFGPGLLLLISAVLNLFLRFVLYGQNDGSTAGAGVIGLVVNIISVILGFISVLGFILMPIGIILLIYKYNKKLKK